MAAYSMIQRFMAYCESEDDKGAKWFILPLVTLSGLIMPVVIFIPDYALGIVMRVAKAKEGRCSRKILTRNHSHS